MLPRRSKTQAFCVASRGALRYGRFFVPGINGLGNFFIALVLALKGYKVRGIASFDMPANWTACHPALPSRSVEKIISRSRLKVEAFAMRILSGRSNWWTLNNLYEFMFGILLLPVTALYLVLGRFYLPKLFFANNGCNGCGRCAENCPAGGIRMVGRAVASVAG